MRAAAYGSASATALSALPDEQEAVDSVGRLLLRMISSHERGTANLERSAGNGTVVP